ncbi:substrate-binding domain-containing protein [Sphingomonas mesophila]|uniref:substrate-binding domain-containing protein n=1 Tax=Sphingomonas mesophila TaxID=2303576 RepID=UPI000E5747D9|nr:substrate-binding domain-containing protein [Sphingomonas mesophila]
MNRILLLAAASAVTFASAADARTQMRAVGSSTVYPFAKAAAERVARANPRLGAPVIESTGTGAGFKLFCSGVGERFPDVSNASRRMKASEAKMCAANGVAQITEIQIGLDGLALATARSTGISGLTQRDLYLALAKTPFGKAQKARTWKDVNGRLPAIPIRVFGPPPTSGTRDSLNELIMSAGCETNAAMVAMKKSNESKYKTICQGIREDGAFIQAGENDNLIVQKLAANPNTLGFFGYSFLEENQNKLKGVAINGVQPTYQSIAGFSYPGARPLYIYVKNAHVRAIPAIRAFVAEMTKESAIGPNGYMKQLGLVAAPNNVRARSQQAARQMSPLNLASLK